MSQFEKAWEKLNRKPTPTDITFSELKCIAEKFGFEVEKRGKHVKLRHRESGIKIPIPIHGKTVGFAYIEQVKEAINKIKED